MLIKIRKKSQITLPADAVKALHLEEGSLLEYHIEKDFVILRPCTGGRSPLIQSENIYSFPAVSTRGFSMHCFGRFRLYYNGSPVRLTRKACELLALLACERGGPISKRTAASLLWSDSPDLQAANNLSHLFRRIKSLSIPIPLCHDKKNIWLDMSLVYCELYEFEELYNRAEDAGACEKALSLYRGLLFYLDCFEWADQWEAYYDLRYISLLERAAKRLKQEGCHSAARIYIERIEQ